jgi:hypothetical protein
MGKVKDLNSRPSPFDAAQAGKAEDDASGRPVPPVPRSRADAE